MSYPPCMSYPSTLSVLFFQNRGRVFLKIRELMHHKILLDLGIYWQFKRIIYYFISFLLEFGFILLELYLVHPYVIGTLESKYVVNVIDLEFH